MAITYSERVAAEVRAEMARQRRTQTEVATAAGWKQPYLNRRLTGITALSVDDIESLALVLGVPLSQLVSPQPREAAG